MKRLTAYELACGCVRSQYVGKINITLWSEHGVYHVRAHDHGESKRLWWDTYHTALNGNARFETAVKVFTAEQEKRDADRAEYNAWNRGDRISVNKGFEPASGDWRPKVRIRDGVAFPIEPTAGE